MRQTTPARPSDTPTLCAATAEPDLAGVAWHLALLAMHSRPDSEDTRRFVRGLLAVALEGEVES